MTEERSNSGVVLYVTVAIFMLVMTMDPKDNRAGVLAFSPDGTKLFTGFFCGSATIWDVRR